MRTRTMSQPVSLCCVLALTIYGSVCAHAQASSPQSGSAAQGASTNSPERPQTEPSQQNPAATQAPQPEQNAPGQTTSPGQTPPAAQSSQPRGIDEELQLTPDQKQKIAAIVDDENRQISAVRDDNSMSLEQKQQKVMEIRQAGSPKIKAILTPEQLQKLAAIQQRMRQEQNNQGTGQSQPGSQPTPQH
jgi:Spy/CpxP family protein refolding chaperone